MEYEAAELAPHVLEAKRGVLIQSKFCHPVMRLGAQHFFIVVGPTKPIQH